MKEVAVVGGVQPLRYAGIIRVGHAGILLKENLNRVIAADVLKGIAAHNADAPAVHQHVGNLISLIRRDGKGLVAAPCYTHPAIRGDLAALSGLRVDCVISRAAAAAGVTPTSRFQPYQSEGGEPAGANFEDNIAVLNLEREGLDLAAGNFALNLACVHIPVQILEVQDLQEVHIRAHGQGPVDLQILAGRDPGVAVVGVHQIQVLQFIVELMLCGRDNPLICLACFAMPKPG